MASAARAVSGGDADVALPTDAGDDAHEWEAGAAWAPLAAADPKSGSRASRGRRARRKGASTQPPRQNDGDPRASESDHDAPDHNPGGDGAGDIHRDGPTSPTYPADRQRQTEGTMPQGNDDDAKAGRRPAEPAMVALARSRIEAWASRGVCGLSLCEAAQVIQTTTGAPTSVAEAEAFVRAHVPGVVVRVMNLPSQGAARVSVALRTNRAMGRVIRPAVDAALRACRNGVDLSELDHRVSEATGAPLAVHATNFAGGDVLRLMAMVGPSVVGRIEVIAGRTVVYPSYHRRSMCLFAAPSPAMRKRVGESGDAALSRVVGSPVALVHTLAAARAVCAMAVASDCEAVVLDCRGRVATPHAGCTPVGFVQVLVPGDRLYQFDMVALAAEVASDAYPRPTEGGTTRAYRRTRRARSNRVTGGPSPNGDGENAPAPPSGLSATHDLYERSGLGGLVSAERLLKVMHETTNVDRIMETCTGFALAGAVDLRDLAQHTMGLSRDSTRALNIMLDHAGLPLNPYGGDLIAMTWHDCWAWHRRPLAMRARVAAAHEALSLWRLYGHLASLDDDAVCDDSDSGGDRREWA
jgi:hypothetical protein